MKYLKRFSDGQLGKYRGLDNGLGGKINRHIYNIQRKCYYLIGGLSNSGKTTLIDSTLLKAIGNAYSQGINIDIFYYSYEIDAETKFAQWLSSYIYSKHSIEISPERIAGLGDNILEPHEKELVEMEIPYMEAIFDKINFRFDPTNPTGIYKELFDFYEKNGTWIREEYKSIEKDAFDNEREVKKTRIASYVPNDPERYVIVVIDHIALCKLESKHTLKDNIDKMSQYCVWLRNICSTTFLILQQFNQGLHSIDRKKYSGEDLIPQQNDFKDSGNPFQDSDVALGIMNPHAMNSNSNKLFGYDISKSGIHKNMRIINIIKNRRGVAQKVFGYYFNAKTATFKSLPLPSEIKNIDIENINNGNY